MERRNKKTKSKGNGEGTIYFSETLQKWVAQYVEPSGKRKTLTQKRNEKVGDFKKRFTKIISEINNNNYIENTFRVIKSLFNFPINKFKRLIDNFIKSK